MEEDLRIWLPSGCQRSVTLDVSMNGRNALVRISVSKPNRLALTPVPAVSRTAVERSRFFYLDLKTAFLVSGKIAIVIEKLPEFPIAQPLDAWALTAHNGSTMSCDSEVRDRMIEYVLGGIRLKRFVRWFMPIYVERSLNETASPLLGTIQHALVEYGSDIASERELRRRLASIAGTVIDLPSAVVTGTDAVTTVLPSGILVQPC